MKKIAIFFTLFFCLSWQIFSQDFGNLPPINKEKLQRDLGILYSGLNKYHSGMYYFTPKDSVDLAFNKAKKSMTKDMNVSEFHKLIAPLVSLSREDHTDISLPKDLNNFIKNESKIFPFTVLFLGEKMYLNGNGSKIETFDKTREVESVNDESVKDLVVKLGTLFASDGFIKRVKFSDLQNLNFAKYYFYFYGNTTNFKIKFKGDNEILVAESENRMTVLEMIKYRNSALKKVEDKLLEFKILDNSISYLRISSFSNSDIKKNGTSLKVFLKNSFKTISSNKIKTVIIDVSANGGGNEGNEGLLYSYFGENYQKYLKVRAKTQKLIINNGIDKPITLKTFGFFEKNILNKKMKDGSLERINSFGLGLMAFKKEPKYKFKGKVYVMISPITYSGGSEFSNMMYSKDLATFVGQETGGGYTGSTSGYSNVLVLPNSQIRIDIPSLHFMMNVDKKIPFGRGVMPHYEVILSIDDFLNKRNSVLDFILNKEKTF